MRVLRYHAGLFPTNYGYVAVLLDDPAYTAQGPDAESAERALSDLMSLAHKENPWMSPGDCQDFQSLVVPVELRPEYRIGNQVLPQEFYWEFRFPCAVGEVASGLRMCVVPWLGLQFYFEAERSLRELVGHYVQESLKGLSPALLLRHVCGEQLQIRRIRVKRPTRTQDKQKERWKDLESVAELAHSSGEKGYGREEALKALIKNLQAGLSVAIIGPASVGKTTLINEAARRSRNIWRTSAARLVAGMTYLGMWEERCERVISQLGQANGVLAVESLADLIRQGGSDPGGSLAAFLTPYIVDGQLQMVVEASASEWQACRRLLPGFADLFRVLPLEAMNDVQSGEVLAWVRTGLRIQLDLDETLLSLFRRFSPYEALPGSAVRFLRHLGRGPRAAELTRAKAISAFSQKSSIPEEFLLDEIALDPEELMARISARVIGQPEAQQAALRIITAFKAGLQDPGRPLGVLLLCGPTGVGKTELAKTLAEVLFSDEKRLIRLDMSEYAGTGAAERLLGSLYDKSPASWLRELRQKPFSVVLFDEVEKAHPEVFDVLLRAFDEGQLCDPWGRVTSLRTAVLLLTSNLGAEQQNALGLRQVQAGDYSQALRRFFRPELINRMDAVVPFRPLTPEVVRQVAGREIEQLQKRPGLQRRGIVLKPSEACLDYLARVGYDLRLGARPLQRLIERRLIPELTALLSRQAAPEHIIVEMDGDRFILTGF
ncbi:ATP-dependent Clp protease ATP-binding subunit [bacterium]|nr:ATP-dependent Clp protease ATP-binding subunit [bacterium]